MGREGLTKYEVIKELQGTVMYKDALEKGVISTTVNAHTIVYETYKSYRAAGCKKMDSYTYTADENGIDEKTVQRVVKDMES